MTSYWRPTEEVVWDGPPARSSIGSHIAAELPHVVMPEAVPVIVVGHTPSDRLVVAVGSAVCHGLG